MATLTKKLQSAHPLLLGLLVSGAATVASYTLPDEHAGSVVGLIFLSATYVLALPKSAPLPPDHYGLDFGGLFEPAPLHFRAMMLKTGRALATATLVALLVLPPFWLAFQAWYSPTQDFSWGRALSGELSSGLPFLSDLVLGHLLTVAVPEEAFFRGWLQSRLADADKKTVNFLGAQLGLSLVLVSALFALGHFATTLQVGRFAVFFPSLLFGWLRARTGGVGASIFLHAQCNVFSTLLGKGYGLY